MSPTPLDVVREIGACFEKGKAPFHLMAEDITWDVPMLSPESLSQGGHAGVADFLRRWVGTWADYSFTVDEIRELPDGRVAMLFTERGAGRSSGVPGVFRAVGFWTVKDGKATAYEAFLDREEALREAGL
jgi:ketosteroid isomerase-like protein